MTNEEIMVRFEEENAELDRLVNNYTVEAGKRRVAAEAQAVEDNRRMAELKRRKEIRANRWDAFWGILRNLLYLGAIVVLFWAVGIAFDAALIAEVICTGARVVFAVLAVVCVCALVRHTWKYGRFNKLLTGTKEGA